MNKLLSIAIAVGFASLTGFVKESANYEQITFDYFVSDILGADFNDITSFEFKGKTERSYAALGDYEFCLKPEEKLGSMMKDAAQGSRDDVKDIQVDHIKGLTILDFQNSAKNSKLFIYPSVHIAGNYYVFLSFQKLNLRPVNYVFELRPEGSIARSCKMN